MRFGDMPVAQFRRFVFVKPQMNAKRDFLEGAAEIQISRGRIYGVPAKNN